MACIMVFVLHTLDGGTRLFRRRHGKSQSDELAHLLSDYPLRRSGYGAEFTRLFHDGLQWYQQRNR